MESTIATAESIPEHPTMDGLQCSNSSHESIPAKMSGPTNPVSNGNDDLDDRISKTIHIDQIGRGDLSLIVGDDRVCFIVCSRTMARSAPFWEKLLYGPFVEGKPRDGSDWKVRLPEDHPRGLEVILNLVHWPHQPSKIPEVDLNLAFEVTVLTNKYSMSHWLIPCAGKWIRDLITLTVEPFQDDEDGDAGPPVQWLWVAQELGDLTHYIQAFKHLAIAGSCFPDDIAKPYSAEMLVHYVSEGTGEVEPLLAQDTTVSAAGRVIMAGLVEEIHDVRLRAIRQTQSSIRHQMHELRNTAMRHHNIYSSYRSGAVIPKTICSASTDDWDDKVNCDFRMLRNATIWEQDDDWPLSCEPETVRSDAIRFRDISYFLVLEAKEELDLFEYDTHKQCTPISHDGDVEILERIAEDFAMEKSDYIRRQASLFRLPKALYKYP